MFLSLFIGLVLAYLFVPYDGVGIRSITSEALAKESIHESSKYTFNTKTTGSTEAGDAKVELTPVISNEGILLVKFKINTHTIRLSQYDLQKITTLEFHGKSFKPVKVSMIGGHHSLGTIVFGSVDNIDSITVRIKGIPKIEERIYEWKIQ
jgi:hypothetical protein